MVSSLWKRYDRKLNKKAQWKLDQGADLDPNDLSIFKTPPEGFVPCEANPDTVSFHWPGWVPVSANDPQDQWHYEALAHLDQEMEEGATYELVGPSFARNIYELSHHQLWKHGKEVVHLPDRSMEALGQFLSQHNIEGIVFHHPDGKMAKIRRKDFKLFWVQEDLRHAKRRRPR